MQQERNDLECILRITEQTSFLDYFESASSEEQNAALHFITTKNKAGLKEWFDKQKCGPYWGSTTRELRRYAAKAGIRGYGVFTKSELIAALNSAGYVPKDGGKPRN